MRSRVAIVGLVVAALAFASCGAQGTRTITVTRSLAVGPPAKPAKPAPCITIFRTGAHMCGAEGRGYCEAIRAAVDAIYAAGKTGPDYVRARAGCLRVGVDLAR